MDLRIDACCIRGMRLALILLTVTLLPGCSRDARPSRQVAAAPDPILYPAPTADGSRYIPWLSGWRSTTPVDGF